MIMQNLGKGGGGGVKRGVCASRELGDQLLQKQNLHLPSLRFELKKLLIKCYSAALCLVTLGRTQM